jgi:outer membrane lipoprotein SlyB
MTSQKLFRFTFRTSVLAVSLAITATGRTQEPVDDATLANNIHAALTADAAIASQPIQLAVVNGVVTLSGTVSDGTARIVAEQDAAKVLGVKRVISNLAVQTAATAPDAPPVSLPEAPSAPAAIVRSINVPVGTGISVRVTQTLDSDSAQEGDTFTGVLAENVVVDGEVVIPAGSPIKGNVIDVHDAGHFKGSSLLSVQLTNIRRRGEDIIVSTDPYTLEGKGRGTNTAEKVGGGAAVGAILGGILGGGKGAAIGAAAGAGAGAGVQAVTHGEQVQIKSESIVRFQTAETFIVRSRGPAQEPDNPNNGGLQPR